MKNVLLFLIISIMMPDVLAYGVNDPAYQEYYRDQYRQHQQSINEAYQRQIIENQRRQIMLQQYQIYQDQLRESNPCFGKGFGCINSHRDWSYR